MCFETRKSPEEVESSQRLTGEDIRELFKRYGNPEPTEPVVSEPAEKSDRHRELSLSER
jgi:hypothetical protein